MVEAGGQGCEQRGQDVEEDGDQEHQPGAVQLRQAASRHLQRSRSDSCQAQLFKRWLEIPIFGYKCGLKVTIADLSQEISHKVRPEHGPLLGAAPGKRPVLESDIGLLLVTGPPDGRVVDHGHDGH